MYDSYAGFEETGLTKKKQQNMWHLKKGFFFFAVSWQFEVADCYTFVFENLLYLREMHVGLL